MQDYAEIVEYRVIDGPHAGADIAAPEGLDAVNVDAPDGGNQFDRYHLSVDEGLHVACWAGRYEMCNYDDDGNWHEPVTTLLWGPLGKPHHKA